MKIRSLIIVGLLASLLFAITLIPASLVWRIVGNGLSMPVSVTEVGGTLWNGYLSGRSTMPVAAGPVVVRWNIHGLHLLLGEAALSIGVEGAQYRIQGDGYWGLWGKGVKDLNGDVNSRLLGSMLAEFGVSAEGMLKLENVNLKLSGKRFTHAVGALSWSGGRVEVEGGGQESLDFPAIRGELREAEGNLLVAVTESSGNKPLGEFGLLLEDGLASVKVLKRVMALVGTPVQGQEDDTLLNLQQPLPF